MVIVFNGTLIVQVLAAGVMAIS